MGNEPVIVEGHDYSFDRDWNSYQEFGLQNTKSASELLINFLKYFSHTFNYDTQEVNPRSGAATLCSIDPISPPTSDRTHHAYSIVIQDPFITNRNLAGDCPSSQLQDIKVFFQQSYSALFLGDIDTAFKR